VRSTLVALTAMLSLAAAGAASGSTAQVIVVPVKLCTPSEVKGAVKRFVVAFNDGDSRQLDRVFAQEPYFRWFWTDTQGQRVSDRAKLLPYFARAPRTRATDGRIGSCERKHDRERLWLKSYGNFEFELVREASDLARTAYRGKGALHCYASRPDALIVWVMGRAA
jgi:hypothetical protein